MRARDVTLLLAASGCGARTDLALPRRAIEETAFCNPGDAPVPLPIPAAGVMREHGDNLYLALMFDPPPNGTVLLRPKGSGAATPLISPAHWSAAYDAGSGDVDGPQALSVDRDGLFFTAFPRAFSTPLDGGVPKPIDDVVDNNPIATDEAFVYLHFGSIFRVPKTGGPKEEIVQDVEPASNIASLAVDEVDVFWLTFSAELFKAPKTGGAAVQLFGGYDDAGLWLDLVLDEEHAYVLDSGVDVNTSHPSSIVAVPKAGGAPTVLAEAQGRPISLAVDDDSLYWVNDDIGGVMRADKRTGRLEAIHSARAPYADAYVVVDSSCVYWIEVARDGGLVVMRAPK